MTTLKKLKIGRSSIITIIKKDGGIDYQQWVKFINDHKDAFVWNEDTEGGKKEKADIHEFPDWAQEKILYSIDKKFVFCTKKLFKNQMDLTLFYEKDNTISINLDKKISIPAAEIILEMANYLGAKVIIGKRKEFYSMEQLE